MSFLNLPHVFNFLTCFSTCFYSFSQSFLPAQFRPRPFFLIFFSTSLNSSSQFHSRQLEMRFIFSPLLAIFFLFSLSLLSVSAQSCPFASSGGSCSVVSAAGNGRPGLRLCIQGGLTPMGPTRLNEARLDQRMSLSAAACSSLPDRTVEIASKFPPGIPSTWPKNFVLTQPTTWPIQLVDGQCKKIQLNSCMMTGLKIALAGQAETEFFVTRSAKANEAEIFSALSADMPEEEENNKTSLKEQFREILPTQKFRRGSLRPQPQRVSVEVQVD